MNNPKIYHLSHIDNLETIIEEGALFSKNNLGSISSDYKNIAYDEIQNRRHTFQIPIKNAGSLHDYVPFYFNSQSPMLYAIKCGNIPNALMEDLIFYCSNVYSIVKSENYFVFTDGHATMHLTEYFQDASDLKEIDWNVINAQYWNNFFEGKRLRQAEFLVKNQVELHLIEKIGVYDSIRYNKVLQKCKLSSNHLIVEIKKDWYF